MGLVEYIKLRRGVEANSLEREAMQDGFLADAMDGITSVEGDHLGAIGRLEGRIEASAAGGRAAARARDLARRDGRIRAWSTAAAGVLIAAAAGAVWMWPESREAAQPSSGAPAIRNEVQEMLPPVTVIEEPIGVGKLSDKEIRRMVDSVGVDTLKKIK